MFYTFGSRCRVCPASLSLKGRRRYMPVVVDDIACHCAPARVIATPATGAFVLNTKRPPTIIVGNKKKKACKANLFPSHWKRERRFLLLLMMMFFKCARQDTGVHRREADFVPALFLPFVPVRRMRFPRDSMLNDLSSQ